MLNLSSKHLLIISMSRLASFFALLFLGVAAALLAPKAAHAATLYWVGSDGANASVASNWKTTNPLTCGSGDASAAPTSADILNFDADCDSSTVIDGGFSTTVSAIVVNTGYTGTMTLANPLTVNSSMSLAGGTWNSGSQNLTVISTFSISNATAAFTASSGTTTFAGSVLITAGTFIHNSGTVSFSGTTAFINCNGQAFNTVNFNGQTGAKTIGATSTCSFNLGVSPVIPTSISLTNSTLSGSGALTFTAGTLTLNSGAVLSGFSALSVPRLTVSGAVADFSGYSTLQTTDSSSIILSSGSLSLPPQASLAGAFTMSGGTLNASSGTMAIGRNLAYTGGTFNHNNGTVEFNGTLSQTISGSLTFYHLKKTVPTSNPLIFTAGTTQTVLGTLTLQGYSNRPLTVQSSTAGTQWNIDAQGSRDMSFVYVKDSHNSNATVMEGGVGSNDLGNNTAWTFPPNKFTTTTGISYTSTLDSLNLKMDVAYDTTLSNAPILLVLHGYSGVFSGEDIIQRFAKKGIFAIKTYKRGYGGSAGISDDSGREIHDFYDAVEYVKTHYPQYVDATNIHVVGYSGGGGNAFGLMTKFPDYFRTAQVFVGMSDYGHDDTYGWWNNGALLSYRPIMESRIGGAPTVAVNNYYARAHYLAAINNFFTRIQLFYDVDETVVPVSHATQYTSVASSLNLTNSVIRLSDSTTTTNELNESFSSALNGWSPLGSGNTAFTRDNAGHMDWSATSTTSFDSVTKPFQSLRSYSKPDHIKASFDFTVSAADDNANVLFSLRNGDTAFVNALSMQLQQISGQTRVHLRADYNGAAGTPLTSANRTIQAFATTLSLATDYHMDLELDNGVLTGTLKDANSNVIETQSLTLDASKVFDGADSFGVSNFYNGGITGTEQMSGTLDNISVNAWTRWIHGYPKEGTGEAEGNISAENYFVSSIVDGTYPQPVLNNAGSMFIPGYVSTRKFKIMLGAGNDHAANLTYDISGDGSSASRAKTLTMEGLTGTAPVSVELYNLAPNVGYIVEDTNQTHGGTTSQLVTSDSTGKLSYTGSLGSTHLYSIYLPSSVSASSSTLSPTVTAPDTGVKRTSKVVPPVLIMVGAGLLVLGYRRRQKQRLNGELT
jgi:pimeloyl-ACP methyl ester carboxylesterase